MKDKYIPIKDAARLCNVTVVGLYQRIRRKKVRAKKVGWIWLIHQDDIKYLKPNHKTVMQ